MKTSLHAICYTITFMVVVPWLGCKNETVIYPEKKDIIEAVYASGKIISENEYNLSALSSGAIIKKLVKDGDTVQKGQLLYVISNEAAIERFEASLKNYNTITENLSDRSPLLNDLKLSMQTAEVKFRNDSVTYHRWKNLWSQNIGTKNNLDNAYSAYQVSLNQKKSAGQKYYTTLHELQVSQSNARSQLTAARKDMHEYFIRSDRDAIVYQTFKEAGETVYINEVVALLGENRERVIRMAVDQQDINKIKTGQMVLLQADITGDTIYEAVVSYIYPVMNEQDQTFRVDARFTAQPPPSFIHSSIEANIIVQKKTGVLVLPRNALAGNDSVWIQVNGKKKKAAIQTGIATLDHVEVVSGLDEKTPVLPAQNEAP